MSKELDLKTVTRFYSAVLLDGLDKGGNTTFLNLLLSDLVNQYRFDGSLYRSLIPRTFPNRQDDRTFTAFAYDKRLLKTLTDYLFEIPEGVVDLYKELLKTHEYILEGLNYSNSLFKNKFSTVVDYLIEDYLSSKLLISGVPKTEIRDLMYTLSDLEKPEIDVYNPFANLASFGIKTSKLSNYYADENSKENWALATLRLLAYNQGDCQFILNDSLNNWNPYHKKYDIIVSRPPLGRRLSEMERGGLLYASTIEGFTVEKSLDSLKENGKAFFLLSSGFFFRTDENHVGLRKYLIDNDLIETVIELPPNSLTHTGVSTAILILSKSKSAKQKGKITMVDGKSFTTGEGRNQTVDNESIIGMAYGEESEYRVVASTDELKNINYVLTYGHYKNAQVQGYSLGKLLAPIALRRSEIIKGEEQLGMAIRIKDLSQDPFNGKLEFTNTFSKVGHQYDLLESEALLVSSLYDNLRPSYISDEPEDSQFLIERNVLAFSIDKRRVSYDYLVAELNKEYVTEQVRRLSHGTTLRRLTKKDFLSIKILLLPLNEQPEEIERYKSEHKLLQLIKEKHLDQNETLQDQAFEQNTHLRHVLTGPSTNITGAIEKVKLILDNLPKEEKENLISMKVSEKHKFSLGHYLDIISRDSQRIKEVVARQLDVQTTKIASEPLVKLDFKQFLTEYLNNKISTNTGNYRILNHLDEESFILNPVSEDIDDPLLGTSESEKATVYIEGNRELLAQMLDNIIENAQLHAFDSFNKGRIEVWLDYNATRNDLTLLVANNGKSMHKDFKIKDYIRKGIRKGKNAGDGYGGWFVNEVIKHHKGSLEIIDETSPHNIEDTDLVTSFEIVLPVSEITTE